MNFGKLYAGAKQALFQLSQALAEDESVFMLLVRLGAVGARLDTLQELEDKSEGFENRKQHFEEMTRLLGNLEAAVYARLEAFQSDILEKINGTRN